MTYPKNNVEYFFKYHFSFWRSKAWLYFVLQKYRVSRDTFKGKEINNSGVLWNRDFNDVPLL